MCDNAELREICAATNAQMGKSLSLRSSETNVDTIDDVNGTQAFDSVATSSSSGIALQHRGSSSDPSIECITLSDDESDSENDNRIGGTGLIENDVLTARDFESFE